MKQATMRICAAILLPVVLFGGCAVKEAHTAPPASTTPVATTPLPTSAPAFTVDAETFALTITANSDKLPASLPTVKRRVEGLEQDTTGIRWRYPHEQLELSVAPAEGYLRVSIRSLSEQDNTFMWPMVAGDAYYIPKGEGLMVPHDEPVWVDYLAGEQLSVLEQLSMPFWATAYGDNAILFIMENPYRSTLDFSEGDSLQFGLTHAYPEIDPAKEQSFRVYLTKNDPVSIAKIYREYKISTGDFVTLAQKAKENPNVEKLYGAPFIYLFDEHVLTAADVKWTAFRSALTDGSMDSIKEALKQTETGREAVKVLEHLPAQDYVDAYQKNIITRALSEILLGGDFYTPQRFPLKDQEMEKLLGKGMENLNELERVTLNKYALAGNFPGVFAPVEQWAQKATVDIVHGLTGAGIDHAWIGLNSWQQAFAKPELVTEAVNSGFLIGAYDSYHSIHKPGAEQWITAAFQDTTLYEQATVANAKGEKLTGFNRVGRKLNPTLALPAVKNRLGGILSTGLPFNSWFIDCDATGEVYDDYSPLHRTTQQEDIAARLERMSYIRDKGNMVIGSEGGNDFAATTIAFAHGIELPPFSWMEADMKTNTDSEYYIGRWYSNSGGVPEHFKKTIPIKEKYYDLFVSPKYQIPLYRLVYNDSVITGYHWDWSTFKMRDHVEERMLREILMNVPPLFHLDTEEWATRKDAIADHTAVWSAFSSIAVQQEMTGFMALSEDRLVQQTEYGEGLSAVANFGKQAYSHKGINIPPMSVLITSGGKASVYTPHS